MWGGQANLSYRSHQNPHFAGSQEVPAWKAHRPDRYKRLAEHHAAVVFPYDAFQLRLWPCHAMGWEKADTSKTQEFQEFATKYLKVHPLSDLFGNQQTFGEVHFMKVLELYSMGMPIFLPEPGLHILKPWDLVLIVQPLLRWWKVVGQVFHASHIRQT